MRRLSAIFKKLIRSGREPGINDAVRLTSSILVVHGTVFCAVTGMPVTRAVTVHSSGTAITKNCLFTVQMVDASSEIVMASPPREKGPVTRAFHGSLSALRPAGRTSKVRLRQVVWLVGSEAVYIAVATRSDEVLLAAAA